MAKTTYKVGDKVRILDVKNIVGGETHWDNGDIVKVTKAEGRIWLARKKTKPSSQKPFLHDYELQYIELVSSKQTKNQRLTSAEQAISTLEQKVEAMQAEIDALKAAQKPPVTTIADAIQRYKERTPNQKRKEIIDEAKAFVEVTLAEVDEQMGWQTTKIRTYKEHGRLRIEFIVNTEKRTVVALARYGNITELPDVLAKGIAKCTPSDVFNADIGKAIALGRALGLDVERYEKAVQPTEYTEGMFVKDISDDIEQLGERYPEEDGQYGKAFNIVGHGYWLGTTQLTQTLDDTEAQY